MSKSGSRVAKPLILRQCIQCLIFVFGFALSFLLPSRAHASLPIPTGLTIEDREKAVSILGFGTALKVLTDPYPLGGYSGYELGLGYEVIGTSEIQNLGLKNVEGQSSVSYLNLTLTKGLFYNVDFTVQFSPLGQGEKYSSFGGGMRWGFWEMQTRPIYFSLQAAATSSSFQEKINTTTQGIDLIAGWNFLEVSAYGGVGILRSSGLFLGGAQGITDNQKTESVSLNGPHTFGGLVYKYHNLSFAAEVDRVRETFMGLRIGLRQ